MNTGTKIFILFIVLLVLGMTITIIVLALKKPEVPKDTPKDTPKETPKDTTSSSTGTTSGSASGTTTGTTTTTGGTTGGATGTAPPVQKQQPVPIYYESLQNQDGVWYYFSDRAGTEAGAKLAKDNGWTPGKVAFKAFKTEEPGTVPVFEEQWGNTTNYHFSTRGVDEAQKFYWTAKPNPVWYAFPYKAPNTKPVYSETNGGKHFLSMRSAGDASAAGWTQTGIAFYAYDPEYVREGFRQITHIPTKEEEIKKKEELVTIFSDTLTDNKGRTWNYFNKRREQDPVKPGWKKGHLAFRAYKTQKVNTVPVYVEYIPNTTNFRWSIRSPKEALKMGWGNKGIGWYAYTEQLIGTVPVYLETKGGQFNLSTRSKEEAENDGWEQVEVAFYAYPEASFYENFRRIRHAPFGYKNMSFDKNYVLIKKKIPLCSHLNDAFEISDRIIY